MPADECWPHALRSGSASVTAPHARALFGIAELSRGFLHSFHRELWRGTSSSPTELPTSTSFEAYMPREPYKALRQKNQTANINMETKRLPHVTDGKRC
jgi:hypothetical protein